MSDINILVSKIHKSNSYFIVLYYEQLSKKGKKKGKQQKVINSHK